MKIYIAGKITGLPRAEIERKFNSAAEKLKSGGHEVFVPTVLPDYSSVPHEDYLHVCYAMIDICEAIYLLSDWQNSKGARMEFQYAADWKKKILYEDKSTIEPNYPTIRRPS